MHKTGFYLIAGLSAQVAIMLRVLRVALAVPGQLSSPLFKLISVSLLICALTGAGVLYDAGGRALLDTFPASTFLTTGVAAALCLTRPDESPDQGSAGIDGAVVDVEALSSSSPATSAATATAAATTPLERLLAKVPDTAVLNAHWVRWRCTFIPCCPVLSRVVQSRFHRFKPKCVEPAKPHLTKLSLQYQVAALRWGGGSASGADGGAGGAVHGGGA